MGSRKTNDARKYRIAMEKAAFSNMKTLFTSKLDLDLWKKLVNFCI
jgi:hypothetical protein